MVLGEKLGQFTSDAAGGAGNQDGRGVLGHCLFRSLIFRWKMVPSAESWLAAGTASEFVAIIARDQGVNHKVRRVTASVAGQISLCPPRRLRQSGFASRTVLSNPLASLRIHVQRR